MLENMVVETINFLPEPPRIFYHNDNDVHVFPPRDKICISK